MDLKQCSGWLSAICVIIEKIVSEKKCDLMHREEIEHKFNILQLEIRTQNEMIKKLQAKNIDLHNELMNLEKDRVKFNDLNETIRSQKKENKKLKRLIAQIKDDYSHKNNSSSDGNFSGFGGSASKVVKIRTKSYFDKEIEIENLKGEKEDLEQKLAMMAQENDYLTHEVEMKKTDQSKFQAGSMMSRLTHNIRNSQISPLSQKLYNNRRDSQVSGMANDGDTSRDARRVLDTDTTVFEHLELGTLRQHSARIESQLSSRFSENSYLRRSFVRCKNPHRLIIS